MPPWWGKSLATPMEHPTGEGLATHPSFFPTKITSWQGNCSRLTTENSEKSSQLLVLCACADNSIFIAHALCDFFLILIACSVALGIDRGSGALGFDVKLEVHILKFGAYNFSTSERSFVEFGQFTVYLSTFWLNLLHDCNLQVTDLYCNHESVGSFSVLLICILRFSGYFCILNPRPQIKR